MEWIVSLRGEFWEFEIGEEYDFYNLWSKRYKPYGEVAEGDVIWNYESPTQTIVARSVVSYVYKSEYSSRKDLEYKFHRDLNFPKADIREDEYISKAPDRGYILFLYYKVREMVNIRKPKSVRIHGYGWLEVDEELREWLYSGVDEEFVLDDVMDKVGDSATNILKELNEKMKSVSPEKVESIVRRTIRKDTKIIGALKKAVDYKCMFSGCGVRIPKKDGKYYIEVHHIKPVSKGGKSVLGNIVVLCPNHHKEFEYGKLEIYEQTERFIRGKLNGKEFVIEYPYQI